MNFRVSGQKINTTTSVKYLGVYLNDSLTWETHFKNLIPKFNRESNRTSLQGKALHAKIYPKNDLLLSL